MGKKPHLSFRYYLKGTDVLRVQIYSLTNGYHRCLTLKGLPQGKWMEGNVNMQDARKPDGTGGPLSENERIDDIQFYCDPRAELLIDDIVLYDTAVEKETRPFPKRILFTGLFDSGKQGKEWPGSFEIAQKDGYFWHAARSVPYPKAEKTAWIQVGLRGERPLHGPTHLFFRYKLEGTDTMGIYAGKGPKGSGDMVIQMKDLKKGAWAETFVELWDYDNLVGSVRTIDFMVTGNARLWIDDLLLYEPGKQK
jgi:hypothetical protein